MSAYGFYKRNLEHYTPWGYFTYELPRDRTQYYAQAFVGGLIPPVGGYHRARDSMAYMDDYMSERSLEYGNVLYPSLTVGYGGTSGLGSTVRSVSRNVESLYESDKRSKRLSASRLRSAFNDGRNWEMAYRWR